jgi:hypothetical protein
MEPRAQLSITLSHDGNLSVTGPITDLILCYGLLELAKDQIRNHCAALQRRDRIEVVQSLQQVMPPVPQ